MRSGSLERTVEFIVKLENRGPRMEEWNDNLIYALRARGLNDNVAIDTGPLLNNAGLKDVAAGFEKAPVGWGNKVGDLFGQNTYLAMESTKPILSSVMVVSEEYYDEMVSQAKLEMPKTKPTYDIWWAYGRKPEVDLKTN
ncbi:hypothetical protein BC938DRAFT_480390 [Jimgerdemannia flammicorona]|uniref:Uncharacterized protein n=1 Tax=Jimgerdemannia flammicorona TaxID=994334 RepID=A0A433QIP2_9FUNG|nr:hypothetical protein BC938DRAFT_480390 [Jimgerdemannia flammicorona]